jgi:hypothetical protein
MLCFFSYLPELDDSFHVVHLTHFQSFSDDHQFIRKVLGGIQTFLHRRRIFVKPFHAWVRGATRIMIMQVSELYFTDVTFHFCAGMNDMETVALIGK